MGTDSQTRTEKLKVDGSTLTFDRPGDYALEKVEREAQKRASEREVVPNMPPDAITAVAQAHLKAGAAERRRIRALPPDERRKARIEALLHALPHRLLIATFAKKWSAVKEITEDALRELGRDVLEEAAEAILTSHFARRDDHRGN